MTLGKVRGGSSDAGNGKRMDPVKNKHGKRPSEMIPPKSILESQHLFSSTLFLMAVPLSSSLPILLPGQQSTWPGFIGIPNIFFI